MKLRVSVTKKDIKLGVPNNEILCPVARAVRRLGYKRISVGGATIRTRNATFELPLVAETFINRFDEDKLVKPFIFTAEETAW